MGWVTKNANSWELGLLGPIKIEQDRFQIIFKECARFILFFIKSVKITKLHEFIEPIRQRYIVSSVFTGYCCILSK